MDKSISTPWAVTAVVIVLLIVGAIVWRAMAPKTPAAATAPVPYAPGGHVGYPPPTPLPPGAR
jgi:hypothetical protein